MLSVVASWIGWRFIPDLVSRVLLGYFHKFYASILRRQPPPPGSPQYLKHRRYLYSFVVLCYMTYTFEKAASSIGPNYYELLGVLPTADEAALKTGFRTFARRYHPDRVGPQGEALFMEVRDAYEALKDPVTRFAYDRFGPSALTWKHCTTMQDYISHGLYQSAAMYVVGVCVLLFWNKIAPRDLTFWNYILISATFAYELLFIFSPSPSEPSYPTFSSLIFTDPVAPSSSGVFGFLWPKRVAYQHISFLKSLSVLFSSALYQVLPNIFPSSPETLDARQLNGFFNLVNTSLRTIDNEAYTMINTELHACSGTAEGTIFPTEPCEPPEAIMSTVDKEVENIILESALYMQGGPLQSMIQQVQRRRKTRQESSTLDATSSSSGQNNFHPPHHSTPSRRQTGVASALPGKPIEGYMGYVRGRSRSCDV